MFIRINHFAFPCDTDCSQYVVPCTHYVTDVGLVELRHHVGGCGLQLILEDYEAQELQITFGVCSGQLLNLHPTKFLFIFGGTGNYTIPLMGIMIEKFVVIVRNCGLIQRPLL